MQINKYLHAAILVSNLEKSEQFYSQVLSLEKVERPLNFPGIWYQIGEFQIHLIQAETVINDQVNNQKWGRNRHLAFAVEDLETAKQQLMTYNCSFQMSASGRAALFTQDPDGNIIELNEA
ncbi:Glyoxalase/bleomycin resistance protein/dioxygenase [Planktothrix tepida]|uniref:Glyoxalase/bleomycin resistance protein/dioxygenase n=2 Tax=Planktothrix TaxID=54304 RepID=A0A1J1LQ98_9CYAN|nr:MULTISPECIES: VOC family protein [Planktothrix]CAD5955193.1 Glyoxalase/bleomycin resistance protein/dioxygenase [Planktothrix tepida]CAD5955389.1 Glyoxalase/bleomycin resistance protein/dioxygenase [Planktothrix pseudagardhii]CUR34186.1 Glyoxalase/bleomycin resistance protein/dioxygenase [Planktothrix tepida PCC 9214]